MEKYNDSPSSPRPSESENIAFLNPSYQAPDLHQQRRRNLIYLTLANLFIFTLSMLSLICAVMSQKDDSGNSAAKLMDHFGIYSPAIHEVEYSRVKFSLPNPLNSSKYVGTTDDVDNAWMDIAYLPDQLVPASSLPLLNKPSTSLRTTSPKTGESGYRVGLEVFHQLHCLNLLRMSTYPAHYAHLSWSDTNDTPDHVRAHLDHCIEILRMNLMCLSDVNVFTFAEVEGREGWWPDYESEHVCRDFERIREWAVENGVPEADV
ncbi:hypothetical protein T440DRAFT_519068 [Plenodomus tracheiphilus IPT5]|uniref:Tat pathway signal sequence n=1 Tax=Plenodomus tracheiphilus IPT5 TaxID=1408161 RepID=A0A6A7B582_9PLEO|nr:hypothetical protein T440DRAFT_519068 [Plenodomus tracheiphilus IPT5]